MKYLRTVDFFDRACATAEGIPLGAMIILTGPPGVGKTTLTRQVAKALGKNSEKLLVLDALKGTTKQMGESADAIQKRVITEKLIGLVVGNMTKDGDFPGPIRIQHYSDVILSLWRDDDDQINLETHKSHFRSVPNKIALTMTSSGLKLAKAKRSKP